MLTQEEENYISKIDPSKKVKIYPFDIKGKQLGESIVSKIRKVLSDVDVMFMGSTALGIDGQKDIDIYILSSSTEFNKYLPALENLFGSRGQQSDYLEKKFVEWEFTEDGYEIEIYLTEPPQRQIDVFNILRNNSKLLGEYERLKRAFNGKKYRDYQKAKYEFFNEILGTKLYQ
jgi:GrpB-like predicted nucleotidyltransferase (UPF0157 family)